MMRPLRYPLMALPALFFALFLALPLYTILAEGLRPDVMIEIFKNQIYVDGLINSFKIAFVTTAIVFVIAVPIAIVHDRYDFRRRRWMT